MGEDKTRGVIENLNAMYDELDTLASEQSEAVKIAKKNSGNLILLKRKNGKEVEISEQIAWDEIRYLGQASEAYTCLAERYPEVFAKVDAHFKKAQEIDTYVIKNIGITSATKVTVRDIIKIVVFVLKTFNVIK